MRIMARNSRVFLVTREPSLRGAVPMKDHRFSVLVRESKTARVATWAM